MKANLVLFAIVVAGVVVGIKANEALTKAMRKA